MSRNVASGPKAVTFRDTTAARWVARDAGRDAFRYPSARRGSGKSLAASTPAVQPPAPFFLAGADMTQNNSASRINRESLRISSVEPEGWQPVSDRTPLVGERVYCVEGPA